MLWFYDHLRKIFYEKIMKLLIGRMRKAKIKKIYIKKKIIKCGNERTFTVAP